MDENFEDVEKLAEYGCTGPCTYVLENDKDQRYCFKFGPGGFESKCSTGNTGRKWLACSHINLYI